MTNSDIVGLAERVKVLEAENDALREALTEISTFEARGAGANYYFEETWRLVDIARAALSGSPEG